MDMIKDVFIAGQDHFRSFRIPSMIRTEEGVLLAFAEARNELNDHAQNKIVLKRSEDYGDSWETLRVIADAGRDSLNNPLVVQVADRGKIILMYQYYPFTPVEAVSDPDQWKSHEDQDFPPNIHEAVVQEGIAGNKICRTFLTASVDDGLTWSHPTDITRRVKRPVHVTNYAGGPGIGVEMRKGLYKGRIVMPFSQGPWTDMKVYAVYSDDGGDIWNYGETAPNDLNGMPNEVQMAELSDGSILLNARPFKGEPYRMVSISRDGGETWSELIYDTTLEDPGCQGSIVRLTWPGPEQKGILLFSNPAGKKKRMNGTIRLSNDDGKSWKCSKSIYKGSFAYSCLAKLSEQECAVLFERDEYTRISFTRLDLKRLFND
jgi:sialidase-1